MSDSGTTGGDGAGLPVAGDGKRLPSSNTVIARSGPEPIVGPARVETMEAAGAQSELILYDRENQAAWLQSDTYVTVPQHS